MPVAHEAGEPLEPLDTKHWKILVVTIIRKGGELQRNHLDGGFKDFLFSSLPGLMIQFD